MKTIFKLSLIAVAAIVVAACTSKRQEAEESESPKSLVLYYSQTGTTKAVAEELQRLTGADIEAVEAVNPYDGDFGATIQRVQQEREEGILPELKPLNAVVADYDIIYLGYPIWFGTYAPPIAALLETEKFEGKKIVPFCTFGSGGLEVSARDLENALPQAEVMTGYGVRTARIGAMSVELNRFLIESNLIEGEVEPLPEFGEEQPVGEAEKSIFDMACGNYQFPLGTPVTYCKREIEEGTEYKYSVDNNTTIYVIAMGEGESSYAEFTKVVR